MKFKFIIAVLLAFPLPLLAAPFVSSDPTAQAVTHCGIVMDAAAKVVVPVFTDATGKYCKFDIASVAVGSHTVKATFINQDPVWGALESALSAPFLFVRPAIPTAAPTGLGVSQ